MGTVTRQRSQHVVLHAVRQAANQASEMVRFDRANVFARGVRHEAVFRDRDVVKVQEVRVDALCQCGQANTAQDWSHAHLECDGLERALTGYEGNIADTHDSAVVYVDDLPIEHLMAERDKARGVDGRAERKYVAMPVRLEARIASANSGHRPDCVLNPHKDVVDLHTTGKSLSE